MNNLILGIETSCDETSASVVTSSGKNIDRVLSNVVYSQIEEHSQYGGVVPEIAARTHLNLIFSTIQKSLQEAGVSLEEISAIAATCGPGLIGGVLVGSVAGKTLSCVMKKPFLAINHLEAHANACRLLSNVDFPYLLLLISGGHCQFLEVYGLSDYKLLGSTIDDSAGEAFDKIARLLGLKPASGASIEKSALTGDAERFSFTVPMKGRSGCDFSFSGLKTAFRILIQKLGTLSEKDVSDISACLQKNITETIIDRAVNAIDMSSDKIKNARNFVLAGGVAANKNIQLEVKKMCEKKGFNLINTPIWLCTDNAAMVAWLGLQYYEKGILSSLDFTPRPRWNLMDLKKDFSL